MLISRLVLAVDSRTGFMVNSKGLVFLSEYNSFLVDSGGLELVVSSSLAVDSRVDFVVDSRGLVLALGAGWFIENSGVNTVVDSGIWLLEPYGLVVGSGTPCR